jgi:hypothetical protein
MCRVACTLLVSFAVAASLPAAEPASPPRPNILFAMADDWA